MENIRPYIFEHTECLREREFFKNGSGGFALIAQAPIQLIGPHGNVQRYLPGETLYNHLTDDLEAALINMLSGTAMSCEARFGASWIISHSQVGSPTRGAQAEHDEQGIDDWLDANTAVLHGALPQALRPDVEPGPFNGLSAAWLAIS